MHFSCKIPNAVLTYLENHGEDLAPIYEVSPLPMELMRDPSYWVNAPDLETFFETLMRNYHQLESDFFIKAGHEGPGLHAWGVLDSVLKMMPRPQEIFNQPEQFLSHFISPKPPIDKLKRDNNSISFDLPLPAEQYPLVTSYLRAALEALPLYIGQSLAQCNWRGITIEILWNNSQNSIPVALDELGHQFSPELFQGIIGDLQRTQREREDLQKQIGDMHIKLMEYEKLLNQTTKPSSPQLRIISSENANSNETLSLDHLTFVEDSPFYILNQNLARLHDYMVRAQQLITLLVSQVKTNTATKEAMRRMDWDYVRTQYPMTVASSMELVRNLQNDHVYEKKIEIQNSEPFTEQQEGN